MDKTYIYVKYKGLSSPTIPNYRGLTKVASSFYTKFTNCTI